MLNNNPHIYLISDSTGETVSIVARSVYARFENINFWGQVGGIAETVRQLIDRLETQRRRVRGFANI